MIIKYCSKCVGRPYTTDPNVISCPVCSTILTNEFVSEESLQGRPKLGQTGSGGTSKPRKGAFGDAFGGPSQQKPTTEPFQTATKPTFDELPVTPVAPKKSAGFGKTVVSGKVSQYSVRTEHQRYHRNALVKLFHAIVFGQRCEDYLHVFTVTDSYGRGTVVNVHGAIGSGAIITDNEEVVVEGVKNGNVLMATKVSVVTSGTEVPVKFQHSAAGASMGLIGLIVAAVLLVALFGSGSFSLGGLQNFLGTWVAVFIMCVIVYIMCAITRFGILLRLLGGGRGRFPLITLLIISFVITLLIFNTFGIGTIAGNAFTDILSTFGPIAIMIGAIIYMIKNVFK